VAARARFFLNVSGRTVPLIVAFLFIIFAPSDRAREIALVASIAFLIFAEYFAVYRPTKDWDRTRREQLNFFFERFVQSAELEGAAAQIRVNVMLKRLHWSGRRLFQYYQYGMEGHPDANLHFSTKRGLCGQILRSESHQVVYKTKAELDADDFGLSSRERRLVDHVMAVATIPLFREVSTFRGNIKYKYFGVVNVDAVDIVGAQLLAEPAIQEQIRALAAFVQITLS
jgi:hypothetical protein